MTERPRRLRRTAPERNRTNLDAFPGLARGQSRFLAPVLAHGGLRALQALGLFAIVYNGDDPDVPRPFVLLVFWVGAAVPVNGVDYDLRYPATI